MNKIKLIIFLVLIVLFFSCKETIIQSDAPEAAPLKFELVNNNNNIYDLKDGKANIEFYLTNISDREIFIPATVLKNGDIHLAQKTQHYRNNKWITKYNISSDSTISIKPQSSIKHWFYTNKKGKWRTIIPVISQDSIYSEEVFLINEIEDHVTFNINQISDSNAIIVNIKNDTKGSLDLLFGTYGYCHFSYLNYSIIENDIYKKLDWDDDLNEWNLDDSSGIIICLDENPHIIIESGSEFKDTIYVKFPNGNIAAKIQFYLGGDIYNSDSINKIFEYRETLLAKPNPRIKATAVTPSLFVF